MRLRRSSSAVLVVAAAALLGSAVPAAAGHGAPSPSPAKAPSAARSGTGIAAPAKSIKAVVVKSWSGCSSNSVVWNQLNANWSSYGSIPISIDYSDPDLCGTSFTLAALEASGADVVILDDPSGISNTFSTDEVNALQTYAHEGHDIIGTYLTFFWVGNSIDNSALAPIFGLVQNDGWTGGENGITPTYTLHRSVKGAKNLLRGLPKKYVSRGYDSSQEPGDLVWSKNDLNGAKLVGCNADGSAAITLYREGDYNAVFIANMPEFGGGTQDQQFLYNAIIYPLKG